MFLIISFCWCHFLIFILYRCFFSKAIFLGKGFEQIVLNQVTEAIHIFWGGKNLGDKLVDVHSVSQNKICAEKKQEPQENECRHLKNSSKGNIYNILQQLIGLAPQQQLLVLGMKMEIIYIYIHIYIHTWGAQSTRKKCDI